MIIKNNYFEFYKMTEQTIKSKFPKMKVNFMSNVGLSEFRSKIYLNATQNKNDILLLIERKNCKPKVIEFINSMLSQSKLPPNNEKYFLFYKGALMTSNLSNDDDFAIINKRFLIIQAKEIDPNFDINSLFKQAQEQRNKISSATATAAMETPEMNLNKDEEDMKNNDDNIDAIFASEQRKVVESLS